MRNLKAILIVLLCLCGIHVQAQQLEIKGLVTSSEDKHAGRVELPTPAETGNHLTPYLYGTDKE